MCELFAMSASQSTDVNHSLALLTPRGGERRIYLDYNVSMPIDPPVAAAMRPFLDDHFGNPSSGHWASISAKAALEMARGQVAALLGCHNDEIVFTSGGSEANNLALKGVFSAKRATTSSRR